MSDYWFNGSTGSGARWETGPTARYRYRCERDDCGQTYASATPAEPAPWCLIPGHPRMVEVAR